MRNVVETLLSSDDPALRYRVLTGVLGRASDEPEIVALRDEIRRSERVARLLSQRDEAGEIPRHPYTKWIGAHWVLVTLAELGYPPSDDDLATLFEQVYRWLMGKSRKRRVRVIEGRARICASQEGNAIFSALALGLADERTEQLVDRLLEWQWPDGGWNCDTRPEAHNSSFHETLIPLRALALHARLTGSDDSRAAAARAAEVFLKRRMFRAQRDGSVIHESFVTLNYPPYWHYDILSGLKVMAEAGFIRDERCAEALDLIESKRLPDGGFPAEKQYYRTAEWAQGTRSLVDWGGTDRTRMNPWVTADALTVLTAAGRGTP